MVILFFKKSCCRILRETVTFLAICKKNANMWAYCKFEQDPMAAKGCFSHGSLVSHEPLVIYGPTGTKNLAEKILDEYAPDITERIHGPEHANNTGRQESETVRVGMSWIFKRGYAHSLFG